jgi:hypothetical protein
VKAERVVVRVEEQADQLGLVLAVAHPTQRDLGQATHAEDLVGLRVLIHVRSSGV